MSSSAGPEGFQRLTPITTTHLDHSSVNIICTRDLMTLCMMHACTDGWMDG